MRFYYDVLTKQSPKQDLTQKILKANKFPMWKTRVSKGLSTLAFQSRPDLVQSCPHLCVFLQGWIYVDRMAMQVIHIWQADWMWIGSGFSPEMKLSRDNLIRLKNAVVENVEQKMSSRKRRVVLGVWKRRTHCSSRTEQVFTLTTIPTFATFSLPLAASVSSLLSL